MRLYVPASAMIATRAGFPISPAFFVAATGNDSNDGSQGSPFLTLAKAKSAMSASGTTKTTYVRGGTYSVTAQLHMIAADAGTTYTGYPGETAVVDGGGTVASPFYIDETTGITIDHLTIQNCVTSGVEIFGYTGAAATGNTVSNCTILNVTGDASSGAGATGGVRLHFLTQRNRVLNNLIQNTVGPSICMVAGSTAESISGNVVAYNRCLNANTAALNDTGAIYLLDRGHAQSGVRIHHNYIQDFSPTVGGNDNTRGIYLDDETSWVILTSNIICGKGHFAWTIHGGDNCLFDGNVFDLTQLGWEGIYQDDVSSGFTNYGMAGNRLIRNIKYTSAIYAQSALVSVLDSTSGGIANPLIVDSLHWSTVSSGHTLPTSGSGADAAPIVGDPMFNGAAAHDYSLKPGSAAALIGFLPINQSLIGPQSP